MPMLIFIYKICILFTFLMHSYIGSKVLLLSRDFLGKILALFETWMLKSWSCLETLVGEVLVLLETWMQKSWSCPETLKKSLVNKSACYSLLWALSTTFSLHCLHVIEVFSDCCNMLTIIFKIEAHQKSSTKHRVRSKNGWATSLTILSIENERTRKLDTSNEVNILGMRKLVNTNFNFSELSYTSFQTSDLTHVFVTTLFFFNHPTETDRIQVWMILIQQKNQCIRLILFNSIFVSIFRINKKIFFIKTNRRK